MARPNYYNNRPSRFTRWSQWVVGKLSMVGLVAAGIGVLGLGWYWQATLQCSAVVVERTVHAEAGEIRELAEVDTGQVLYDIDPAVIRDRVRHHPWVEDASVSRIPTGTLTIEVKERTPSVLVISAGNHRPAYYLDYAGYQMPTSVEHLHNVPLVRGLQASYEPGQVVQDSTMRSFLKALEARPAAEPLISEIRMQQGTIHLRTVASPDGEAIPVRMGRGSFDSKLTRLSAFWEQAVRRYDRQYRHIDLRFDDQVVVRETS